MYIYIYQAYQLENSIFTIFGIDDLLFIRYPVILFMRKTTFACFNAIQEGGARSQKGPTYHFFSCNLYKYTNVGLKNGSITVFIFFVKVS